MPFLSELKQEKEKEPSGHGDSTDSVQTSVVLGRVFREVGGGWGGGPTTIETTCFVAADGSTAWTSDEDSWLMGHRSSSAQGPHVIPQCVCDTWSCGTFLRFLKNPKYFTGGGCAGDISQVMSRRAAEGFWPYPKVSVLLLHCLQGLKPKLWMLQHPQEPCGIQADVRKMVPTPECLPPVGQHQHFGGFTVKFCRKDETKTT